MLKKKGRRKGDGIRGAALGSSARNDAVFVFAIPDFHKDPHGEQQQQQQQQKKKGAKFKPIKVLKRLSHKGEPGKSPSKDKTP